MVDCITWWRRFLYESASSGEVGELIWRRGSRSFPGTIFPPDSRGLLLGRYRCLARRHGSLRISATATATATATTKRSNLERGSRFYWLGAPTRIADSVGGLTSVIGKEARVPLGFQQFGTLQPGVLYWYYWVFLNLRVRRVL